MLAKIMSVGDDDDPADMELTRALDSWIDPVSATIVMEAHTARLAFFGNHTAWPIAWGDVDDPSFSARRYENWDIIETLERQWLQLLDKKVQKLIAKNRSTAAAFESLHIVRKDGSRTEFRWDMVEGIASLADEEPDLNVPIGPMAVFDWVVASCASECGTLRLLSS